MPRWNVFANIPHEGGFPVVLPGWLLSIGAFLVFSIAVKLGANHTRNGTYKLVLGGVFVLGIFLFVTYLVAWGPMAMISRG